MAKTYKITPNEGRVLRTEHTGARIPEEGMIVESSPYWQRYIDSGDAKVEEVAQDEAEETTKSASAKPARKEG